jgi:DNA-binding NarL/FixJ family response regulator
MSGAEVLQELRRLRSDVKVLISTAYDETAALELVRGCGFAGFIQKPYTASALIGKLRGVLES